MASTSSYSLQEQLKRLHRCLIIDIAYNIDNESQKSQNFLFHIKMKIGSGLYSSHQTFADKIKALEFKNVFGPENYEGLKEMCRDSGNLNLIDIIENCEDNMKEVRSEFKNKAHTCPSNWTQVKKVGSGAFGEVFLCFDHDSSLYLAAKMVNLNGQNAEVSKCAQSLENEISLLRDLHHERIVQYLGCSVETSRICIFMEYMQGGSILDIINTHGALTEQVAARYTQQILDGLVFLHGKKILHRDIKGANVLLDKTGDVKLADFGTSKQLQAISNVSGLTPMVGTPHWMAPEVIKGEKYGQKADIWSVGCTVVEMLTKKPPWGDLEKWPAMYKIGKGEFPHFTLPNDLSSHTDDFLGLAFKRDLMERPTAEALLQHPFVNR